MTYIVYSDQYKEHNTGSHPENQERLNAIVSSLKNEGLWDKLDIVTPEAAKKEDLLRVHTEEHVEYIKNFCKRGGGYIDYDTFAAPKSYEIAKLAAGGAIDAAKIALLKGDYSYSIARPPGHHATIDKSMGFCIFNNLAIALERIRHEYNVKKFLIFDIDVHFGNGTSDIFYNDPNVLYISIHQNPHTLYPGRGFVEDIGIDEGQGYNINIPMSPGSSTDDYICMVEEILIPVASEFNADFCFLDVGFDGHVDDPLSSIDLTDEFYEYIAQRMKIISHSMALVLEGGYNLDVLSRCNIKMINTLNSIEIKDFYKEKLNVIETNQSTLKKIKETFSPFYKF